MANPSWKSADMEVALKDLFGVDRVETIQQNKCTWCDKVAEKFRDALSQKEYTISGMCQECQDSVFGV